jgi:hypothetical protein
MPSPVKDRPGVLLRDPFGYAEGAVVVPPPLVPFLRFFDGGHDEGDLATALRRATGEIEAEEYARGLAESLGRSGFLEDAVLDRRRDARHQGAHVGRRYGDATPAVAGRGALARVEERDRERIAALVEGDADAFWALVQQGGDDLRWCGASALYTFLRAVSPARGALLRYEQWNIDPESVVSFGALAYGATASAGE